MEAKAGGGLQGRQAWGPQEDLVSKREGEGEREGEERKGGEKDNRRRGERAWTWKETKGRIPGKEENLKAWSIL